MSNNQSENESVHLKEKIGKININEISLFDHLFDKNKEEKIHQIKTTSLLYDISLQEFLYEFQSYENQFFDKTSFINVISGIIQKKTSNIFKGPTLRYSLSLLYQYINIENKVKISYYEVLGALIILTKAKNEEKIKYLCSFPKKLLVEILSGILSLYINPKVIKDISIFVEFFIKTMNEAKMGDGSENLVKWIFEPDNNQILIDGATNRGGDFLIEEESNEDSEENGGGDNFNDFLEITKLLDAKYLKTKFASNSTFSIIEVTKKLVEKYSLLGQVNMYQLSSLVNELLTQKLNDSKSDKTKDKEKKKVIYNHEFISFVEKYFDFTNSELVEITYLHALFLLIFSGSTTEKIKSIFMVFDVNENGKLDINDFTRYLTNMFHFLLLEMKLTDNNISPQLAKIIIQNISQDKSGITFAQLLKFFDGISL